jgi:hypothetical protein
MESTSNCADNGGLTREIHPIRPIPRPDDQSSTAFRIGNNTTLTHTQEFAFGQCALNLFPKGIGNATGYQAPMASSTMNSSQIEGLTREILPSHHMTVNGNGNATFRVDSSTTIVQETSVNLAGYHRSTAAMHSLAQFGGNTSAARDLMPPPTPRGRPTTAAGPSVPLTPQPHANGSVAMGAPSSALRNNLDMSVSFRDPVQQQHHISYATWESRLGPKTCNYLKNYTKMRVGEKAQHWLPVTEELQSLDRSEFEKFAQDFVHAFYDWFMPSVRSHFEMQEVAAVPFSQWDTHPAIVNITGGPEATTGKTLEELLSMMPTRPPPRPLVQ